MDASGGDVTEPIWSTGGTGGERAVLDDLEWAVNTLRAAADDVASAGVELARRRASMELDPQAATADLAAALGDAAHVTAPALEGELDDTATRLAAVAEAFLEAERRARQGMGILDRLAEFGGDVARGAWWLSETVVKASVLTTPFGMFVGPKRLLPDAPPPTTGIADRDAVEAGLMTSDYLKLVATIRALTTSPVLEWITAWSGHLTPETVKARPAESLEDVMERLWDTEQAPGGAVRIERWTDEEGVTRRIVYVPGTEDWLNASENPFDAHADLDLMLGRLPDAAHVVTAALVADGAQPGDPVMLAGHSLGGIVATALAGNTDFAKRFNVKALVTAGSPVGRIALPAATNALHFEGTRDVVTALDARPNPDTPTRITVHHDARRSGVAELAGEGEDLISAHHLDTYAQSARLVDGGLSHSTEAWLASEREFLANGKEVVVTEYRPDA